MSRSNQRRSRKRKANTDTPSPNTSLPSTEAESSVEQTPDQDLAVLIRQHFEQLEDRLDHLDARLAEPMTPISDRPLDHDSSTEAIETQLLDDIERLQRELAETQQSNEELRSQNEDLASRVAAGSVQGTVNEGHSGDESLSWEDRKALILQQMENEDFDANHFVESLADSAREHLCEDSASTDPDTNTADEDETLAGGWPSTPLELVDYFEQEIEHLNTKLADRETENGELQYLLQQQSETRDGGVAIGAAAIASMVDSDELVMQERQRLQQLKDDWEDKFRQAEIEASLERAKLSRERQELAQRAQELEEGLARLEQLEGGNQVERPSGRRWLAELGLSSEKN